MKYAILHSLSYAYDSPVRSSTQYLRLTPRDTARQKVLGWTLEAPGKPMRTQDGYGNVLHVMTIDRPVSGILIRARGTVQTSPTTDEPSDFTGTPLSPLLFLRVTALTRADEKLAALAEGLRSRAGTLAGLRELAAAVHQQQAGGSAADLSHAFIACCRHLGVPARYVSGYAYSAQSAAPQVAMHAWVEAWVAERWRSFDVAHDCPIGESHIKIAAGADYLDTCPVRGVRTGGGIETLLAQASVVANQ
jgi:transglutaminase-like putative cysteine protease